MLTRSCGVEHVAITEIPVARRDGTNGQIVQAGEAGLLIAEWFAYTPTSGTDIAVTSNLATIS